MNLNKENLSHSFPEVSDKQIGLVIKYQEKFSLTLENLKCLNPDCNKIRAWNSSSTNFKYCCSKECTKQMKKEIDIIRIQKQLGIKSSNDSIKKRKETNSKKTELEKKEIQKKREETCLLKYGVRNQNQCESIIQKRKQTLSLIPKKIKENRIEKGKSTYFNRTGYSHPLSNPKNRKKINPNYTHITNFENWDDKDFWINNFITDNNYFNYHKVMLYFNCGQPAAHNQVRKLGIKYTSTGGISFQEQVIVDYLRGYLELIVIQNDRTILKPMELDIWLPELNLAIEWNGTYWHSYHETIGTSPNQLDQDYNQRRHQAKSSACLENGIRLLHLYEDLNSDNWMEVIDNFLVYEPELEALEFDLDSGCYPLGLEFDIIEPESRMVLKDRTIWNSGRIKLKEKNDN